MTTSGTPLITHASFVPTCGRYLASTKHFQIPILSGIGLSGGPVTVSEYCEQRAVNIADNQLQGALNVVGGVGHGIFEEGIYTFDEDTNTVTLHDLRALINGIFIENSAGTDIDWVVDPAQDQYLFVSLVEDTSGTDDYKSSRQFGEFNTRVSTSYTAGTNEILLALKPSGVPSETIINVPQGPGARQTLTTVENHILRESPHGGLWRQDDLYISGITGFESFITSRDETTIFVSGVFVDFEHTPESTFNLNANLFVESGITVDGKFVVDNGFVAVRKSDIVDFFSNNMWRVESGLHVRSTFNVRDMWTFDDFKGFTPTSGIFGIKTSDGQELKVVDISENAQILNTHINAINPHRLIASGVTPQAVGVLSIFGDTLHGNLGVDSGISADGIDFSTLTPLIDGSVITTQHTHFLLQNPEYQYFLPSYPSAILSGIYPGWLETGYDPRGDKSFYSWYSLYNSPNATTARIIIKPNVPEGYEGISGITIWSRVSSGASISNCNVSVYDSNNTKVGELHQIRNTFWDSNILSGITGTFTQGSQYKIQVDLTSEYNIGTHVSDIRVMWNV